MMNQYPIGQQIFIYFLTASLLLGFYAAVLFLLRGLREIKRLINSDKEREIEKEKERSARK